MVTLWDDQDISQVLPPKAITCNGENLLAKEAHLATYAQLTQMHTNFDS